MENPSFFSIFSLFSLQGQFRGQSRKLALFFFQFRVGKLRAWLIRAIFQANSEQIGWEKPGISGWRPETHVLPSRQGPNTNEEHKLEREAQQRYFSYRAMLAATVTQNPLRVFSALIN